MMRVFTGLLLLFGLLAGLAARAQGLDPTFAPTLMKGDYTIGVRALAVQPDGKVLVGGNYDFVGGALNNKVLRLNADGSRDGSFQPTGGANGQVSALAIQPDGKILIAGAFSGYDGTVTGPLARLNANGTLDASFNVGSGAAGIAVYAVLVQPDGKIVVGGDFTGFNGGSTGGVVRLNANGSTDTGFNVGGTGTAYVVASLALQPDGKLLAGGGFRTFNGTAMPRLVRLLPNGTLDTSFQTGTGPNTSLVARVRVLGSGQILIAGGFSAVNGQRLGSVMRLSATGSVDTSFGTAGGVGITGRCFDAVE